MTVPDVGLCSAVAGRPLDPTAALNPKVDIKARIAVRGSHDPVPVRALPADPLNVGLGGRTISVLADGQVISVRERSLHKSAQVLALDHYLELLSRLARAVPGSIPLELTRASGGFTGAHERFATTRPSASIVASPGSRFNVTPGT